MVSTVDTKHQLSIDSQYKALVQYPLSIQNIILWYQLLIQNINWVFTVNTKHWFSVRCRYKTMTDFSTVITKLEPVYSFVTWTSRSREPRLSHSSRGQSSTNASSSKWVTDLIGAGFRFFTCLKNSLLRQRSVRRLRLVREVQSLKYKYNLEPWSTIWSYEVLVGAMKY